MKKRLSLLIPLILIIVSLASSLLIYLQEVRASRIEIEQTAIRDLTREMGSLQNVLYNRLTANDTQEALLSLSLAATHPGMRKLMLVNEQHRILMANRYGSKGEAASTASDYDDERARGVIAKGVSFVEYNQHDTSLLQGYFPLMAEFKPGGLASTMGVLYAEYDISALLYERKADSQQQAAIFAVIGLFAALTMGLMLHWLVTRRVNLLSVLSGKIAAGDYHARCNLKGNDELSQLGLSFDVMAQSVTEHIAVKEFATRKLEHNQLVLSEAQKIASFGSWELDLQTGELTLSKHLYQILESQPIAANASFEVLLQIVHPADRDRVNRAYHELLLEQKLYELTHRLLMSDGRIKWVEVRCSTYSAGQEESLRVIGTVQDVTLREENALQLRIAAVAFDTQEAIMVTDEQGLIIKVNAAFEHTTGYTQAEVEGHTPRILQSGQHDANFYRAMWQAIISEGKWAGEVFDRRKSGEIYPKWLTITAVKTRGEVSHYVAVFVDITERKKAEDEIRNLAFYDPLTRQPNRRLLMDRLRAALSLSVRSRHYGAVLFLDMDKFKIINDTLGHDYGDLLLVQVAERIQSCVRDVDTVARLGGDEFVVLLEEMDVHAEAASQKVMLIAEKIRAALTEPYQLKQHVRHSSPSIGICLYFGTDESADNLLKHADLAMYQVKDAGRNAVRFFDPAMQLAVETHAALEADLRHAVQQGQLQLYYQIQVDGDHIPVGAEALLRWIHPERGMVSPAKFIPVAEESALIIELGNWALDTACRQLSVWAKDEQTRNLTLAVNVSAKQFKQLDFVAQIDAVLRNYAVEPSRLKLELTESVVLNDVTDVIAKMHALKALGIKLSMDDFGTGYSSLSYLKLLPLDQLKIDQSFVRDIASDPNDAVMVKTIIDMGRNFRLHVIAEGVETESQFDFLKENGCMAYQGYLFSKPVPIELFAALL